MTPRELKAYAARRPVKARVVSDGCRDYVLEVVSDRVAGLLRHRSGRTLRFRSLGEIRDVLGRCGVDEAVICQRVADDEVCHPGVSPAFHELPLRASR